MTGCEAPLDQSPRPLDDDPRLALGLDPVLALRVLLPHWFPKKMPWVHRGILAILLRRTDFLLNFGRENWAEEPGAEWTEADLFQIIKWFKWQKPDGTTAPIFVPRLGPDGRLAALDLVVGKYTAIMMPRGFSKTTLCNGAAILQVLYRDHKFTLYVGETGSHASRQLGNVKRELASNDLIQALYGNCVPDRNDPLKNTDDILETTTELVLMARGRGGQVRGLNHNSNRPDNVIVDDLEDLESVSTPEQRNKVLEWFMADLKPVLPKMNPDARMTVLGTLLDRDALMMRLARDTEWTYIRFGAKLADGTLLWPEMMDEEKLAAERHSYAIQGKTSKFYMEYMSELRDDESAKFRPEFFEGLVKPRLRSELLSCAIVIDPAISQKKTADSTAIAVVGMTDKGMIHICETLVKQGMDPREQVDEYFRLAKKWDCNLHGVEAIAYQSALIFLLREEMFRKKQYFEVLEIRHGATKKTERIEGILQPRFASRYISFQTEFRSLVSQLLDWPNGGFDESDAVAMATGLLLPYAAAAADPDTDLAADEYEPLSRILGSSYGGAP